MATRVGVQLGSVYMRREEFSKAVSEYDEVIGMDAALPAPYVERAQAYAALGLYRKAVTDLEQYLKMTDPQRQRVARVNAAIASSSSPPSRQAFPNPYWATSSFGSRSAIWRSCSSRSSLTLELLPRPALGVQRALAPGFPGAPSPGRLRPVSDGG